MNNPDPQTYVALSTLRGAVEVYEREEAEELRRELLRLAAEIKRKMEREK